MRIVEYCMMHEEGRCNVLLLPAKHVGNRVTHGGWWVGHYLSGSRSHWVSVTDPFACSGTRLVPHWWHGDALLAIARRVAISGTTEVAVDLVIDGSLSVRVHHPVRILFSSTAQLRRTARSDHLVERYAARSALLQLSTYVEPYDEDKHK